MRRIVRFHPTTDDKGSYDENTILQGLLDGDVNAQVGSNASVFEGNMFDSSNWKLTGNKACIGKLLIPIDTIPNIFCIGLNYKKHAEESKMDFPENPVIFMKPTTTLCNPNDNILIPTCCQRDEVDYEVELVVVIGKKCHNVSIKNGLDYVFGYTIANDVSARNWQINKKLCGGQWIRGKSFDTFSPIGPCLLLQEHNNNSDVYYDCNKLNLWSYLENETRLQDSNTKDFIFNVQKVVSFLSQGTTLLPGTIILTGTPEGVGFARKPPIYLKKGDVITVGVENIGELTNYVENEPINSKI